MTRRILAALALAAAGGSASAFLAPVSAYDFDNTLAPSWSTNANVGPLDYRIGGTPTSPGGAPNYLTDTVGSVTKQVVDVPANRLLRALHGVGSNGGGQYVNLFSILMDVRFSRTNEGWASLLNTSADNGNDGDSFVQWGVGVGTGGSYGGAMPNNAWTRLVMTFQNSPAGTVVRYYINGSLVHTTSGIGGGLDSRWTLYSWNDNDTDSDAVDILGDNDGDVTPARISQLAFWGQVLTDGQVGELGPVGSTVPEPATLAALGLGLLAIRRRGK